LALTSKRSILISKNETLEVVLIDRLVSIKALKEGFCRPTLS